MYFVPHLGHAKVYETSIWTPCFQISAKTLVTGDDPVNATMYLNAGSQGRQGKYIIDKGHVYSACYSVIARQNASITPQFCVSWRFATCLNNK